MRANALIRLILAAALAVGAGLAGCRGERRPVDPETGRPAQKRLLRIYVANSMRLPMERCMVAFKAQHPDSELVLDFGDSGDALARIREWGGGEALVLHEPYLTQMIEEGLGQRFHVVAHMRPAIILRKDDPKTAHVTGLKDVDNPDLRVGVTDARATISGGLIQAALAAAGIQQTVMARHPYQNRSSGAICAAVAGTSDAGPLDVGLAWESVARGIEGLRVVRIEDAYMPVDFPDPEMPHVVYRNGRVPTGLVVLTSAEAPEQTATFVEFILSPAGQAIWREAGFDPVGDGPAPVPAPDAQPD